MGHVRGDMKSGAGLRFGSRTPFLMRLTTARTGWDSSTAGRKAAQRGKKRGEAGAGVVIATRL